MTSSLRRVRSAACIVVLLLGLTATASAAPGSKIKAVAFDAFPVFDPRPVFDLAEKLFPGKGAALCDDWRARQFEYTWLRSMSGTYADFWQVTEDALVFAAKKQKLQLSADERKQLMDAYLDLKPWPDAPAILRSLKGAGIRLVFLSNFTSKMLEADIKSSGLEGIFEQAISTDRLKTYKPDPRAYQMAVDALGLKRDEIVFVAFAGWDAAGAKAFGYKTFWVNRLNLPLEELGVAPDAASPNLSGLEKLVNQP
ncbi:MAG: haloacid dehalogenase type II [Elusimicrobiota bacterium]